MYPTLQPPDGSTRAGGNSYPSSSQQYPTNTIHYPSSSQAYAPPMVYRPAGGGLPAATLPPYARPTPPAPPATIAEKVDRASSLMQCRVVIKEAYRIDPAVPAVELETETSPPLEFDSTLEKEIIKASAETDADDLIGRFGRAQDFSEQSSSPQAGDDKLKLPLVDAWASLEERFVQMGYDSQVVRLALCQFRESEEMDSKVVDFCDAMMRLIEMVGNNRKDGTVKPKHVLAAALWRTKSSHDLPEAVNSLRF